MDYGTFTLWISLPFTAVALGWLCRSIAVGKGRSGWWGLLGLLHVPGIVAALVLHDRRRPWSKREKRRGDTPEPSLGDTKAASVDPARSKSAASPELLRAAKLLRRRRDLKRPLDFRTSFGRYFVLAMYGWAIIGPIMFLVGVYGLVAGNPVTVDGVKTQWIPAKLYFIGMASFVSVAGILYVVLTRRDRRKRAEARENRRRKVRDCGRPG